MLFRSERNNRERQRYDMDNRLYGSIDKRHEQGERKAARYPLKVSFLKIFQKIFSRRACPRKTAKSAQQVATDLLGAEMFCKEDCLHGIVHIQSRTAPTEGLRFF